MTIKEILEDDKDDVDIEDLNEHGWTCAVCHKKIERSRKHECNFQDCLWYFRDFHNRKIKENK